MFYTVKNKPNRSNTNAGPKKNYFQVATTKKP